MGLTTEFFVSDRETASSLEHPFDLPREDTASYKGLTDLEVSILQNIIQGKPVDDDLLTELEEILVLDEGERVTTAFAPEFIRLLAALSDDQILKYADAWSQCAELSCEGAELVPVITDLRSLAQRAIDRNLGLYLWNSV